MAGITYGLVLGCIVKYIPERTDVSTFEHYFCYKPLLRLKRN